MSKVTKRQVCMACAALCLLISPVHGVAREPNRLTPEKRNAGFEPIFDGKTLDGWTQQHDNWTVEDGVIYRARRGGKLVFAKRPLPDDFEFRFEWKVVDLDYTDPAMKEYVDMLKFRGSDMDYTTQQEVRFDHAFLQSSKWLPRSASSGDLLRGRADLQCQSFRYPAGRSGRPHSCRDGRSGRIDRPPRLR
ncbi:MAG: DUF1080 domain-containing protein [Candidatus Nealsonbacteria bacterium]|nr:DUF1080 domain-containing protein [Candidatus Nealsonbacteria bacterium]